MDEELLAIEHLSYDMGRHDPLVDISLSLSKGENAVFFGPENSGIETLMLFLLDIDDRYEGVIRYKNADIREFDYIGKHNYRREIGYVHGMYGLISNMSVEDNISLPLEYHSRMSQKEIKRLVDRLIYELNLDYCKKLRPVDLSNSEALRTSYARAIAMDPELLIVKHAFEGQSPLNIRSFMDNLKERASRKDKSLIIVTYEPEKFIDFSDRFIMIFNGRVVFDGNRESYLDSENRYLVQYKEGSPAGPMAIL